MMEACWLPCGKGWQAQKKSSGVLAGGDVWCLKLLMNNGYG